LSGAVWHVKLSLENTSCARVEPMVISDN